MKPYSLSEFTRLMANGAVLGAALCLPLTAAAQSNVIQDTTEFAKVLNYSPIPGPQVARQICNQVTVSPGSAHNPGAAVAGGLVGAVVGSRFGGGHGKDAATVAGAIGGTLLGDQMGSAPRTQEQCSTVFEPGPPAGYQVTYDYKGKLLTTTTRTPPGEYLRVHNRITLE
ncbi:MAG: glycine zipper 2TM domain-containing protein [Betaproteobacteria bacterium]|nr:glycine zipper 2TM domain-containing protein [Betaproteobacteria bacterium]